MITIPIEIGDILLGGRFKNHKITVKEIGYDEYGSPTINGRSILKVRVPKLYQNQNMNESVGKQVINYVGWWQSGKEKTYIKSVTEEKGNDFKGIIVKYGYLNQFMSRDKTKGWFEVNNSKILYPKHGVQWEEGQISLNIRKEIKENKMKKLRTENHWNRTMNVKVKKEGDRYYNYLIHEGDEDECLSPVGFETKELAKHSAMMKGFNIIGEDVYEEDYETSEPLKPTKREKTPNTEKPKEEKLSKGTELKIEGLIRRVLKEELKKKNLSEADVTNTDLESKARRYASLAQKMKRLEEELEVIGKEYEGLDNEFRQLLEAVGTTKDTFIRAGKLIIKIEREGFNRKSKSYKTGFDYLYNKVNATMKDLATEALKLTETTSYVKSKISVVGEGRLNENWFTKIKSFLTSKIKKIFGLNDQANTELSKLEKMV